MVIIPRTMTVIEKVQILSLAGLTKIIHIENTFIYSTYQYKKEEEDLA